MICPICHGIDRGEICCPPDWSTPSYRLQVARRLLDIWTACRHDWEALPDPHAEDAFIDVRLQVYPDGQWAVRFGAPDYDQDHRGYWGAAVLTYGHSDVDYCLNVADDLIAQVEQAAGREYTEADWEFNP